jgi:hypothetical protein
MKKMYALTFTNNGNGMDSRPYGATIAVSTDVEKLKAKMQECVEEDCLDTDEIEDFDGNEYAHNFEIYRESSDGMSIELESKLDIELTLTYEIEEVEVL